ncbi:hypothetical protein [Nocardia xishanensis]
MIGMQDQARGDGAFFHSHVHRVVDQHGVGESGQSTQVSALQFADVLPDEAATATVSARLADLYSALRVLSENTAS